MSSRYRDFRVTLKVSGPKSLFTFERDAKGVDAYIKSDQFLRFVVGAMIESGEIDVEVEEIS